MKRVSLYFFPGCDNSGFHQNCENEQDAPLWTRLRNELLRNGYDVDFYDVYPPRDSDILLCYRLPELYTVFRRLAGRKMHATVYQQFEPPVIDEISSEENMRWLGELFGNVLCWNTDFIDDKRFFLASPPMYRYNTRPPEIPFKERKLLTNISGNKAVAKSNPSYDRELYSERARAIRFMEENHPEDFEFFGTDWSAEGHPCYGGRVDDKIAALERFRFSVCFENMRDISGYVTEKIFDCFTANTVPIYWGACDIREIIPPECYIDFREFEGFEQVYRFIRDMPESDFNRYLEAKNRIADSVEFKRFLPESFIANTLAALERVTRGEAEYSYVEAWRAWFKMAALAAKDAAARAAKKLGWSLSVTRQKIQRFLENK